MRSLQDLNILENIIENLMEDSHYIKEKDKKSWDKVKKK